MVAADAVALERKALRLGGGARALACGTRDANSRAKQVIYCLISCNHLIEKWDFGNIIEK